jgi:hypothetical protein
MTSLRTKFKRKLSEKNMNFANQTKVNSAYFQNMNAIAEIEEISDEAAATYSGGARSITLYDGPSFGTIPERVIETDFNDLSQLDFNNKTSSLTVNDGVWAFFPGKNFSDSPGGSKAITLTKGAYKKEDLEKLGLKDNTLSSVQLLRTP